MGEQERHFRKEQMEVEGERMVREYEGREKKYFRKEYKEVERGGGDERVLWEGE